MAYECRNIAVFDLETWSLDTKTLEAVELAAVVIDGQTLEPIQGGEFQSYMKPKDWDNFDQKAINVNKITHELLKEKGRERGDVLRSFGTFLNQFKVKGIKFGGAPIASGKNIHKFDLPILDRICREEGLADKNGENKFFDQKIRLDLEDLMYHWFQGDVRPKPATGKMDDLRTFFGLSHDGAHGALVDCKQTALLVRKFMALYRKYPVSFENACKDIAL
jgi:inhibitor of KinA sporulation pathway (predicted exonuclease)